MGEPGPEHARGVVGDPTLPVVATAGVDAVLDDPLPYLAARARMIVLATDADARARFVGGRLAHRTAPAGTAPWVVRPGEPVAGPAALLDAVRDVLAGDRGRRFELVDGAEVLDVVVLPVLDGADGPVRGTLVLGADVSAQRVLDRRVTAVAALTADGTLRGAPLGEAVAASLATYASTLVLARVGAGAPFDAGRVQHPDPDVRARLQDALDAAGPDLDLGLAELADGLAPGHHAARAVPDLLRAVGSPPALRDALADLGAHGVLLWSLQGVYGTLGVLAMVLLADARVPLEPDPGERDFLGAMATRAAMGIELGVLAEQVDVATEALFETQARFRSAFDDAPVGMAVALGAGPRAGTLVEVNAALQSLLDLRWSDLMGATLVDLVHPDDRPVCAALVERLLAGEESRGTCEARLVRGDGDVVWVHLAVQVADGGGGQGDLIVHAEDVTSTRAVREELAHQAMHDTLTQLPNRHLAADHLRLALADLARHDGGRVAVLFADLDRFKEVNDTYGHPAGDQVLVEVSRRLRSLVREGDTAARWGGDELVVVCPRVADVPSARRLAERLRDALGAPIVIDVDGLEVQVRVGVSVGVTVTGERTDDVDRVLREADAAMYEAKRRGRGRVEVFDPAWGARAEERARVLRQVRRALGDGRLALRHQPVVDLGSGRVLGVEVFVALDEVGVDDVVGQVEDSALLHPVGEWLVASALRQLGRWRRSGLVDRSTFVLARAPGRLLESLAGTGALVRAARAAGVPRANLVVALPVSALLVADVREALAGVARQGLGVCVDLEADVRSPDALGVPVRAVRAPAALLASGALRHDPLLGGRRRRQGDADRLLVAVGVRTAEDVVAAAAHGFHAGQGPWFAEPTSPEDLATRLADGRVTPSG
ncbi:diguanylate cyclase domain-containing protein [Cellulomonas oligotrophica]|uniref:Diguanylate cyclase (GGDEF)-like protein/PAS domain S-box-containing protein n=1 Tax=Cellulomonas oligotrophica TaxID=931536 RepID=A0A7Y9FEH1_9CELL|nr:diguanylate cyclase [Cellulomonas oligotrophica]NYD85725.1 diguanylate cyclase (GGDEF)-like protein/PAS domain S-box-containing protein [Cellulomonas oligotrophica]GIG31268.1 hypothetical protein Col01nite_04270 [Cellulomonas oligotrophica]